MQTNPFSFENHMPTNLDFTQQSLSIHQMPFT
jgi:hypothetical protein